MAAKYYGVPLGGTMKTEVTTGAATTSLAVELVIADTAATGQSKLSVLQAIDAIRQKVVEDTYPVS